MGDRALYISGVVPRSMSRSPVGVGYVKGIGTSAYRAVTDGPTGGHLDVLRRIAAMFDDVADVIGDVANPAANDGGLLELYDRWRREGSDSDLRKLIAAGVLIDPDRSDVVQ